MIDINLGTVTVDALVAAVDEADDAETTALIDLFDPTVFARLIKRSSDDQIRRLLGSEQRTAILDRVMLGMVDAFRPDRAGGQSAVIHWKILERPGGGEDLYEQVIDGGTCTFTKEPLNKPDAELRAKPVDFAKLICGFTNPTMALARGRLKISGDLNLARRYDGWFSKPEI